ncbi:MAG: PilZ domain-containing protein [Pseudolabrys sp.]|nr:PilZ domain-containing protein [Pseudolabrys sp.]
MEERRQYPRHKVLKGGMVFCDGVGSIDCVVRNLSDFGACIEFSGATRPADTFDIIIKPETHRRTCQAIWRKDNRIGVRFI